MKTYQAYVTKEKRSTTQYCAVERTTRTTYYHGFAVKIQARQGKPSTLMGAY